MSRIVVLIAILGLALAQDCTQAGFDQYIVTFKRTYVAGTDEYNTRLGIWTTKCVQIQAMNAAASGVTFNVGPFTDRLDSEIQQILSAKPGEGVTYSTWEPPAGLIRAATSLNWNTQGKTTPVKNQGTCGSCWCFATTAHYETTLNINGKGVYDLSEEYVLECTNGYNTSWTTQSSCAGGVVAYALPMIGAVGLPTQTTAPYAARSWGSSGAPTTISSHCRDGTLSMITLKTANNTAPKYTAYTNVTTTALQGILASGSAVALIYADSGFMSYSSGVYGCPSNFATSYASINHAVQLVGYDSSNNWILKNSWDTTWGVSGYGTVSNSADCAITAYIYQLVWEPRLVGFLILAILALMF